MSVTDLISRQDAIRIAEQGQIQGFPWQFEQLVKLPSAQPDKDMLHLQREQAYMQGWEDACKSIRLANIPSPHKEQKGLHSSTVSRIYDRGWQDGQNALREERNDKTGSD